ncbi:MAG: hypothetical protein LBS70_08060 [Candidatus Accumulibacter sp.]|jgi:hypothetical protein|nr:hypothetical protein [Accumulibacter sp.]
MKYRYNGPISAVSLKDGAEVMLHPGKTVELPAEHEYTKTLLARGHLTPDRTPTAPANSGSDASALTKASAKSSKDK